MVSFPFCFPTSIPQCNGNWFVGHPAPEKQNIFTSLEFQNGSMETSVESLKNVNELRCQSEKGEQRTWKPPCMTSA